MSAEKELSIYLNVSSLIVSADIMGSLYSFDGSMHIIFSPTAVSSVIFVANDGCFEK